MRPHLPSLLAAIVLAAAAPNASAQQIPKLHLEIVGSDSTAFDVTATLIVGPSEVLLWDAQYHRSDATRLADRIAATGKHLKAIVLSHADHDHFMGATTIVERFPGTPVYIAPAGLAEFNRSAADAFNGERSRNPAQVPDSLITPALLPSNHLTVDGQAIEVIPDLTGDVLTPSNSFLWIPSLHTVLAGDIVFNEVHPWLGASDSASRQAWHRSLQRIATFKPDSVVAGHKRDPASPDTPEAVFAMDHYLTDFDALRATSSTGPELAKAMMAKYPGYAVPGLLFYAAQMAYQKKSP